MQKLTFFDKPPEKNLFLAPMYKVSELPFRLLCKEQGATMVFTEMANTEAIKRGNKATFRLVKTVAEEKPVGIQLFGAKPKVCAIATAKVCETEKNADVIDFNLGCPVQHIRKQGAGAALLCRPTRISEILKAMVDVSDKPVSAKIRSLGSVKQTVDVAKIIERAGASFLTVHAKTIKQMYSGEPDYAIIKAIKQSVGIPVVGNGNVRDKATLDKMLDAGVDAIMVGRAALGNPGIFSGLQGKQGIDRIKAFFRYLEIARDFDCLNFGYAKLQAVQFSRHLKNHELTTKIERSRAIEEIETAIKEISC
jgi:nifR3 family TIM-barrel protein